MLKTGKDNMDNGGLSKEKRDRDRFGRRWQQCVLTNLSPEILFSRSSA
jgi:hypothetical protein